MSKQPKIVNSKAKLRKWFDKWTEIRDTTPGPAIRAYAVQYLAMLARQGKEKDRP